MLPWLTFRCDGSGSSVSPVCMRSVHAQQFYKKHLHLVTNLGCRNPTTAPIASLMPEQSSREDIGAAHPLVAAE